MPVACKLPATLTFPLESVIKSESLVWPITDPLIVTLPAANVPAVTAPVVDIDSSPTSIDPNPDAIEPALKAPTVTIVLAPSLAA